MCKKDFSEMTKEELVSVATEQEGTIQGIKEAEERLRKQLDALVYEYALYQMRVDELYKKTSLL